MIIVFVLGMHRSGTSCLTRCLESAGLQVRNDELAMNPDLLEPMRINNLHERVLNANGGSWDAPPERMTISPAERRLLKYWVSTYPEGMIGIKDPRLLLFVDDWLEELKDIEIRLVGTFRNPVRVAHSLFVRNGFAAEKSFGLWRVYNEKLVAGYEKYKFPIVKYDLASVYLSSVQRAAMHLGLSAVDESVVQESSEHHREDTVPPECEELYSRLESMALI